MFTGVLRAAAVAAALALPQTAAAGVIYSEAVSGDASTGSPPFLALDIGTNDILGSVTLSSGGAVPTDNDAFVLVVGSGRQITSILFSMTLAPVGEGLFTTSAWFLSGPSILPTIGVQIPSTDLPAFTANLPLGQGTYLLKEFAQAGSVSRGEYRVADYKISATVESTLTPIPLPAAAGLLAASLVALGALRRRRA